MSRRNSRRKLLHEFSSTIKEESYENETCTLLIGLTVFSVIAVGWAVSQGSQQGTATLANAGQTRPKKLREIAMERDIEVEGVSESHGEYATFESLRKEARAIVYGRILTATSFFDESGAPIERGENITTEYTVDVLRVLKDATLDVIPSPDRPVAVPLRTPLKIARNGGVVSLNGHRASVKVKGFEDLNPGKQYVFFLYWSRSYNAYILAGGISGAVMVNDDLTLKPLGSAKEIQSQLRRMNLEDLIDQIKY
jgi:hypothetical protein